MNCRLKLFGLAAAIAMWCMPATPHPGGPDGINRPAAPAAGNPIPPDFEDQVAQGYLSLVRVLTLQVAHAHDPATRDQGVKQTPPAEVWYLATVKPVDRDGLQLRYCVSPRIELPGDTSWAPHVKVSLWGSETPGAAKSVLAEVETSQMLPAGASVELASSGKWCVLRNFKGQDSPPAQYLATQHGRRRVEYPQVNFAQALRAWQDSDLAPASAPARSGAESKHRHRPAKP